MKVFLLMTYPHGSECHAMEVWKMEIGNMNLWQMSLFIVSAAALFLYNPVVGCNEALCASVVSKCMLTQSCKCDLKNCSCCKECFSCLGDLYSDCCSCVDMCPKRSSGGSTLSRKSHVEDFPDPQGILFKALTAEPDALERWITYTTPIDIDTTHFHSKLNKEFKYHSRFDQDLIPTKDIVTFNCTVAYISQCVSWNKCKMVCHSMGSSSYRWFHDGCCECIGQMCINYGINESRCPKCPGKDTDRDIEEEDVAEYNTYTVNGEGEIPDEQLLKK